jgi:hypothetical protein
VTCPVTGEPLGSMGPPVKVIVQGQPVFLCCAGCEMEAQEHAEETLKKLEKLTGEKGDVPASKSSGTSHVH